MAQTTTDNSRFFGLDLSQWPRQWQAAGALLLAWPGLRWLTPAVRVRLLRADGHVSDWAVTQDVAVPVPLKSARQPAQAWAVELPRERALDRRLTLPPLAPADLAQAVQLEAASASPFAPGQTVRGHAAAPAQGGVCRVDVVLTSRQQIEQTLQEASAAQPRLPAMPEVWSLPGGAPAIGPMRPVVLQGFGEGARQRIARRGLSLRLGLLALVLVLLGGLLVTPSALLRQRARQAERALDIVQRQAAPQIAERETLMHRVDRLQAISQVLDNQLAPSIVLDLLTRTVPDGAWLTQLRLEGNKVILNGNADDAAALVQKLSAQPGVSNARMTQPATRAAGALKETFVIEMNLDAHLYGLAHAGHGIGNPGSPHAPDHASTHGAARASAAEAAAAAAAASAASAASNAGAATPAASTAASAAATAASHPARAAHAATPAASAANAAAAAPASQASDADADEQEGAAP
jgi:general secretion pathway protein L